MPSPFHFLGVTMSRAKKSANKLVIRDRVIYTNSTGKVLAVIADINGKPYITVDPNVNFKDTMARIRKLVGVTGSVDVGVDDSPTVTESRFAVSKRRKVLL